jgi:hypothetical protein
LRSPEDEPVGSSTLYRRQYLPSGEEGALFSSGSMEVRFWGVNLSQTAVSTIEHVLLLSKNSRNANAVF